MQAEGCDRKMDVLREWEECGEDKDSPQGRVDVAEGSDVVLSEFGFAEPRGPGGLRAEMFPFHSRLGRSSLQLPSQTAGRAKCKTQGSSRKVGDRSLPQTAGRLLLELLPGRARALLVFIPLILPFRALARPMCSCSFLPVSPVLCLFPILPLLPPAPVALLFFFSKSAGPGTGWASRASLGKLKKLPSVPSGSVQVSRALQQLPASRQPAPTGGGGVLKPTRSGVLRGDGFCWACAESGHSLEGCGTCRPRRSRSTSSFRSKWRRRTPSWSPCASRGRSFRKR